MNENENPVADSDSSQITGTSPAENFNPLMDDEE